MPEIDTLNMLKMSKGVERAEDDTIENEEETTTHPAKGIEKSKTAVNNKAVDGDADALNEEADQDEVIDLFYDAIDDLSEYVEELFEDGDEDRIALIIEKITALMTDVSEAPNTFSHENGEAISESHIKLKDGSKVKLSSKDSKLIERLIKSPSGKKFKETMYENKSELTSVLEFARTLFKEEQEVTTGKVTFKDKFRGK